MLHSCPRPGITLQRTLQIKCVLNQHINTYYAEGVILRGGSLGDLRRLSRTYRKFPYVQHLSTNLRSPCVISFTDSTSIFLQTPASRVLLQTSHHSKMLPVSSSNTVPVKWKPNMLQRAHNHAQASIGTINPISLKSILRPKDLMDALRHQVTRK
jgi:hypothetical protein